MGGFFHKRRSSWKSVTIDLLYIVGKTMKVNGVSSFYFHFTAFVFKRINIIKQVLYMWVNKFNFWVNLPFNLTEAKMIWPCLVLMKWVCHVNISFIFIHSNVFHIHRDDYCSFEYFPRNWKWRGYPSVFDDIYQQRATEALGIWGQEIHLKVRYLPSHIRSRLYQLFSSLEEKKFGSY